ncbi:hypothetical protein WK91_36295 [Burkholderia cepacia]|uniref:hypothetical protein n=1 Tax=Burkholderia cepacia TaxID=292 RepID=UPI00075C3EF3|nr:hypothetical protein [Burkholderia cepacia]KVW04480.1 hypothetical protein WK91_36295 [Burkholderia cepacia]
MSDDASAKAYWDQLFSKRYWLEAEFGMPPKEPWAPTGEMLAYELGKTKPARITGQPTSLDMAV